MIRHKLFRFSKPLSSIRLSLGMICLILAGFSSSEVLGQIAQKSGEDSQSQQLLDSIDWHRPYRSSLRDQVLEVRTVLKFGNPSRAQVSKEAIDGMVLFCIDRGRPIAVIHVFVHAGIIGHRGNSGRGGWPLGVWIRTSDLGWLRGFSR